MAIDCGKPRLVGGSPEGWEQIVTQHAPGFTVRAEWDDEARVWYVAQSDVPGLVAEADTIEELARKLDELVPELIERNAHLLDQPLRGPVPVNLIAHQKMAVRAG